MKISKLRGMPAVSIYPRVFPGPSTEEGASGNRAGESGSGAGMLEACDWGSGRLFAYAHFTVIIVCDVESGQVVATLDGHSSNVTCVRLLGYSKTGELLLASGDQHGWVMVWDTGEGEALRSLSVATPGSEGTPLSGWSLAGSTPGGAAAGVVSGLHQVMGIRPIEPSSSSKNLSSSAHSQLPFRLLCLSPTALTLLDIANQSMQWRCELATPSQPLSGLSVNSRDDCIVYSKAPMLKVVLKTGTPGASHTVKTCDLSSLQKVPRDDPSRESTGGVFLGGDRGGGGSQDVLEHAAYCPANRSHVYLVFSSEVVLYDLDVRQRIMSVCSVSTKRSELRAVMCTPGVGGHLLGVELGLSGVAPFLTLHHDGSVSAWTRSDARHGYVASSVDLRSSRQGYAGRPFLVGICRTLSLEAVLAQQDAEFAAPNSRICVVSNDGSVSAWHHGTEAGWALQRTVPAIPTRVAAMAVVHLQIPRGASTSDLCFVLLTTNGLLMIYDVLTGTLLLKTEVMSERGCVPCHDIHCLSDTKLLIAGVRAVPKKGGASKSKGQSGGLVPSGLLNGIGGLVRDGTFSDTSTTGKDGVNLDLAALGAAVSPSEDHHNYIAVVTVPNLEVEQIKGSSPEAAKLLSVGVANSRRTFTALHTGGVVEVWDVATRSIVRRLTHPEAPTYSVLTWMPRSVVAAWDRKGAEERHEARPTAEPADVFIWIASDGSMTFFKVANNEVSHYYLHTKERIYVGFGFPVVAVDWFDGLLLLGDSAGHLCLVNLRNEKFSYITHQPRCPIKQLRICPRDYLDEGDERGKKSVTCLALVLFTDGEYGVWNVAQKQRLSFSRWEEGGAPGGAARVRHLKASAVGWAPGPFPVVATTTGCIYIMDLSLASSNSPVSLRALSAPMRSTALLPRVQRAFLLASLCNGVTTLPPAVCDEPAADDSAKSSWRSFRNAYGELVSVPVTSHSEEAKLHLQLVPPEARRSLEALVGAVTGEDLLQRCFIAAAVFADELRMQFYKTAQQALKVCKESKPSPPPADPLPSEAEETRQVWSHAGAASEADAVEYDELQCCSTSPIEEIVGSSGLLHTAHCCTAAKREQAVRGSKSHDQFQRIAEQHVRLGAMTPACRLLLDTPTSSPEWKANLYKACVVAAGVGRRHYQNTVKRVASMLVANEEIESAVEMLCLIGKGREACMVYQAHDMWEESARLAKTCLASHEANEVIQKWAVHLAEQQGEMKVMQAAVLYLTTADLGKTLELLEPHLEYVELAAQLAMACVADGVLRHDDPLVTSVYSQYTDFLLSISATDAAKACNSRISAPRQSEEAAPEEQQQELQQPSESTFVSEASPTEMPEAESS